MDGRVAGRWDARLGSAVPALLAFALVLTAWTLLGDPARSVAERLWRDAPAPWERVAAEYVPDAREPERSLLRPGLDNLQACRQWVYRQAALYGDQRLRRGDWHCHVGRPGEAGHRLSLH